MLDYFRNPFNGQTRSNVYFLFLTLLLVVELGLFTFLRTSFAPHTLPFLFLGTQLTIGILPLFLLGKRKNGLENDTKTSPNASLMAKLLKVGPLSILAILGVSAATIILLNSYSSVPIRPQDSDIIPQIQVLCNKFLAGEYPYKPFDDFGYTTTPTIYPLIGYRIYPRNF
jgi:hypothetical protein